MIKEAVNLPNEVKSIWLGSAKGNPITLLEMSSVCKPVWNKKHKTKKIEKEI